MHKLNLYIHSVLECQIRLYEWLLQHLMDLLDSIGILSTGHLPPFSPTVLNNITTNSINLVCKSHPDYVLAIDHITEYHDMKLATFGVDAGGNMIIAFPVFVKDHTSEPKTLYEVETVKIPIPNENKAADSYSEVKYSKPYLAINDDYYIQLIIQELRMCKQIRHTYYCEELFLVKHKSKHSCESAIFYNLTFSVVYSVCQFNYYYNTTVTPSVLDGSSHVLLANMLSPKRLFCSRDFHMAHPVPSFPYVLVNRSVLCNCHLESGLTYLLKYLGSCSPNKKFTMYFTINSAFNHYMSTFGFSSKDMSPKQLLTHEPVFDIFLNDSSRSMLLSNHSSPVLPLNPPDTLLILSQSINSRSPNSPNSPSVPIVRHTSNEKPRKSCVLMCILASQIYLAFKHKKFRTLVTAMAVQWLPAIEAMSAFEIPNTKEAKLICQDPWVSIAVTIITILGVAVYLYKTCTKVPFFKGYLYDNVCTVYLFISHDCYHVPLKPRELNGILHTFTLNGQPKPQNIQLLKYTLWDTMTIKWLGTTLKMKSKHTLMGQSESRSPFCP